MDNDDRTTKRNQHRETETKTKRIFIALVNGAAQKYLRRDEVTTEKRYSQSRSTKDTSMHIKEGGGGIETL